MGWHGGYDHLTTLELFRPEHFLFQICETMKVDIDRSDTNISTHVLLHGSVPPARVAAVLCLNGQVHGQRLRTRLFSPRTKSVVQRTNKG